MQKQILSDILAKPEKGFARQKLHFASVRNPVLN